MLKIKTKRTCSQTNGQDDASEPPTKIQRQRSTSKSRIASESCRIVCVTHIFEATKVGVDPNTYTNALWLCKFECCVRHNHDDCIA